MSLFFFHLHEGSTIDVDTVGVELADVVSARREANIALREMVAEDMVQGLCVRALKFEICDNDGLLVGTVSFRDVLDA